MAREWRRIISLKNNWPELRYQDWRETVQTLQLWMQIVGKVRLALTPWLNHSWQVPLYVTSRGLGTSPIPFDGKIFELEFDFLSHRLVGRDSMGGRAELTLEPMPVADFYQRAMLLLRELGVQIEMWSRPSELADPIPFELDRLHRAYDPVYAQRFWQVLVQADSLFKLFRTGFLGKASPSHFFWGGFDLAVTRFSGRTAPPHPGGIPGLSDRITREAYSHEVSSAGFWPGNDMFPHAAFYAYAYPEPSGFRAGDVPAGAGYNADLGEFILLYETVRSAERPKTLVLDFLQATYSAAADLGKWDRASLDCALGVPNRPRPVRTG